MDPISQAAFERRVRNRRLRAIAREARRLRREKISETTGNPKVISQNTLPVGSPHVQNGFRPINNRQITTPPSSKTASPIKKTHSGCGSCRKRAEEFARRTRQAISNKPTVIDVGKRTHKTTPHISSLEGRSSQPIATNTEKRLQVPQHISSLAWKSAQPRRTP